MTGTAPVSGDATGHALQVAAHLECRGSSVAPNTKSRTYRLPVDLWERIRALQEQREAELRALVPEYQRDSVRVQEVDVVRELLLRGLEMVDAEQKPRRPKR